MTTSTRIIEGEKMKVEDKEMLIGILNNFETRSNKDVQFLMEISFRAGQSKGYDGFESFFNYIKRELLEL